MVCWMAGPSETAASCCITLAALNRTLGVRSYKRKGSQKEVGKHRGTAPAGCAQAGAQSGRQEGKQADMASAYALPPDCPAKKKKGNFHTRPAHTHTARTLQQFTTAGNMLL